MDDFAGRLDAAMAARNIGVRALARRVHCDPGLISRLRSGKQQPSPNIARLLDEELGAAGALAAADRTAPARPDAVADDEIAAIEVVRRAAASDVGEATFGELERITDDMALAYPRTSPGHLLARVRSHLGYASGLLAGRTTLNEHRRLLVTLGWLSLLASTCLIDLRKFPPASAYLRTAAELARETGHREIAAWCLETKAWQLITEGDYPHAAAYAQAAQRTAPPDGSAFIQATGQEARAWARLGAGREAREALARTEALVAPLPMPDRPEHHYQYDPAKSDAYTATTLAWLGDPAAAGYARDVLSRLESGTDGPVRPRRAASARLDLALALTASDELDEAADTALAAVTSGLLVPSNYWRATEVIGVMDEHGVAVAGELREAYREHCGLGRQTATPAATSLRRLA
jgi:transcriptional regulator with XRE-family HTH domain